MSASGPVDDAARPSTGGGAEGERGFALNLVLFVVLTALTTVWFTLHVRSWFERAVLIGGVLTFLGLFRLALEAFKIGAGKRAEGLVPRLLGARGTLGVLVLGLVAARLLYGVTSSLYVVYKPDPGAAAVYEIEPMQRDHPNLDVLKVTSSDKVAGRPFFFSRRRELSFKVLEPCGFTLPARTLGSWTPLQIAVPEALAPRRLWAVHAVAGYPAVEWLPLPDEQLRSAADGVGPPVFDLKIDAAGARYEWPGLRRNGVYLGAASEDLRCLVARQGTVEGQRPAMERRLEPNESKMGWLIEQWQDAPEFLGTSALSAGQRVTFELLERGFEAPKACAAATVPEEPGVLVVFLDPKECP